MGGILIPVLLVGGMIAVFLVRRRRARFAVLAGEYPELLRPDTHTQRARGLGILLALVIALIVGFLPGLGRLSYAIPALAACCVALTLTGAEWRVWHAAQTPGEASLEVRTATGNLPFLLTFASILSTAVLVPVLVWCSHHQTPCPNGTWNNPGSEWCWGDPSLNWSVSGGPFPGTWYSVPLLAALVLLAVIVAGGLVLVARRPRNGADPLVVAVDDEARRRSTQSLWACLAFGLTASALMVLSSASSAMAFITGHVVRAGTMEDNRVVAAASNLGCTALALLAIWEVVLLLSPDARTVTA